MPPPELAPKVPRLPPILHKVPRCSMPGYSKGSRGLSVLPQEHGICTATPTSLSLQSRQWGIRYAIRAGRNLPDKEFRYLRTVIVTAAVYWGLSSKLLGKGSLSRADPMTSPHDLPAPGRRQTLYILVCEFAESCVFVKQSIPPSFCPPIRLLRVNLSQLQ